MDSGAMYGELDRMFAEGRPAGEIEDYLRKALKEGEDENNAELIIAASNELGGLCRVKNDFEEAIALHLKVLELLEEAGQRETENYATALINYGDVFAAAGKNEGALEVFTEAERMLSELGLDEDYRTAALRNNMSGVYLALGDGEKAEKAIQGALEIIERMPDKWAEAATSHINLGAIRTDEGRYDEALENFFKAEKMFEDNDCRDHHYAAALAGEAKVRYLTGNCENAAGRFREAAELIRERYGENETYRMLMQSLNTVNEKANKR